MTGIIRCLILDDDPNDVIRLTHQLQRSDATIEVRSIERIAELRDALAEPCDILLADYRLTDATALDALRVVAEVRPGLPVIVVSGVIAEEEAGASFRAGARDFVTKGRLDRLARAIRHEVEAADERERTVGLEGRLAASEIQVSAVLSRLPGLFWTVDRDLRYVLGGGDVLQRELPGWAGLVGSRLQDAPGVTQEMIAAHEIALGGTGVSFEFAVGARTISARIEPILAPDGTVSRLAGFGLDVSADRERERRTVQLATVVDVLADPVIVVDTSGATTTVNPAVARVLGPEPEQLIGVPLRELFRGGHAARIEDALERVLSGEAVEAVEASALRSDESLVDLELSLAPIVERGTVIRGAAIVARDVSARNALQAELRQAQKMEAVGRLASGIAHDLNNVLLAVRGYASLLQEDLAGTAAVADVQEIADAAARATALVGRLLAFTRHQVLVPRIVDVGDAVERVTTMLRAAAGPGIELLVEVAPGLPAIEIDPVQIDQLLLNLVINARDAMGERGRVTVTVALAAAAPGDAPAGWIEIVVADSGPGVPPELVERVFEPFFTTKDDVGAGLGLSIVAGIVAQVGGTIELDGGRGQGAVFTLRLPAVEQAAEAREIDRAPAPALAGGNVLVVDEDDAVRAVVQRLIERIGYTGTAVPDCAAALALIEAGESFDVILTDLASSEATRDALLAAIVQRSPAPRVVVMAGAAREAAGLGDLPPGTRFLAKPFGTGDLDAALRRPADPPPEAAS